MSINHLTSQTNPQSYLNPRVNSLVVDGVIHSKTYAVVPSNYGINGYNTNLPGGGDYAVVIANNSSSFITDNANNSGPTDGTVIYMTNGIEDNVSIGTSTSQYWKFEGNLSFVSDTDGNYGLTIYVGSTASTTLSIAKSLVSSITYISVSDIMLWSPGVNNRVKMSLSYSGIPASCTVHVKTWSLSATRLSI